MCNFTFLCYTIGQTSFDSLDSSVGSVMEDVRPSTSTGRRQLRDTCGTSGGDCSGGTRGSRGWRGERERFLSGGGGNASGRVEVNACARSRGRQGRGVDGAGGGEGVHAARFLPSVQPEGKHCIVYIILLTMIQHPHLHSTFIYI